MKKLLLLVTLLLPACASLTAGGERVAYTNGDASRYRDCQLLGQVEGTTINGPIGMSGALAELRNNAAARGATNVNVLQRGALRFGVAGYIGEAYRCPRDVGGLR